MKYLKTYETFDINLANAYNKKAYTKEPNVMSDETHSFLVNWSWNSDFLHYYQTHGVEAIDKDIVQELSQWKPKEKITLYRGVCDKKEELKYKNKLKSYFHEYETAKMLIEDMECYKTGGYIQTATFEPNDILVDITLIPNYSNLDLIAEVIAIIRK